MEHSILLNLIVFIHIFEVLHVHQKLIFIYLYGFDL